MNTRTIEGDIIDSRLDDVRSYDGVLTRRMLAFVVDYVLVALISFALGIGVFLLGILTLGLGWMLFAILVPAVVLVYIWTTLGGPNQATPGMRMMNIRLERLDGGRIDGFTAVVHTVLFWAGNALLTPLILLATLFLSRKRTLHDLLLGTVVIRTDR
jgi:uncharacterized RDD family membrane protein YckC